MSTICDTEDRGKVLTEAAHTYLAEMITAAHGHEHMDVVFEGLGVAHSGDFSVSAKINQTNVAKSDTRTLLVSIVQRLLMRPEIFHYLLSYGHHYDPSKVSPCSMLLDPLVACGKSQELRLLFPSIIMPDLVKPQLHWESSLAARWRVYNPLVNSPSVIMPASKVAACKKAASKV